MTASTSPDITIGFLTVFEPSEHLLIGGYLILNSKGRPVEFHCTAPVMPNRAQQILYGATLRPYLCGEQIGQALVCRSKQKPILVCTDVEDVMEFREMSSVSMVLAPPQDQMNESPDVLCSRYVPLALGDEPAWLHPLDRENQAAIEKLWCQHFGRLSFAEPFGRIRDAIREAQRDAAA